MTERARAKRSLLAVLGAATILAALAVSPSAASDRQTGTVKGEAAASQDAGILSDRQTGTVKREAAASQDAGILSDRQTGTVKWVAAASQDAGILSDRQTGTVKWAAVAPATPSVPVPGTWMCSVPSGYVYTQVRMATACRIGTQAGPEYKVQLPANGLWSCARAEAQGFTFTQVTLTASCLVAGQAGPSYKLATPVNRLWACSVPPGFGYSETRSSAHCHPSWSTMPEYRLVAP